MKRTFNTTRLFHQFLKPNGLPMEALPFLIRDLYQAGFIDAIGTPDHPEVERYSETDKLTGRKHRDELFKIIQELK